MIKTTPIYFKNFGFLTNRFSDDQLKPIIDEIKDIQNDFDNTEKFNYDLAGNIKKEFLLPKSRKYAEDMLIPMLAEYNEQFNFQKELDFLTKDVPVELNKLWVNFQSKNEFNPNHRHNGFMTFVIWIKIPYTVEQENAVSPGKESNKNCSGQFEFQYTNALGDVSYHLIPVDKSMENTIVMFPAKISHCVYPFYSSDEYRIIVSGNFKFKVD